jgi:N-methylhydantoinase A
MGMKIGIDIGGTFTDFVVVDEASGEITFWKSPSTPFDFATGVEEGLKWGKESRYFDPNAIRTLIHGSTVATNAILEKKWKPTGLLTTEGFADLLAMGDKYKREIYNIRYQPPELPIPPSLIKEIPERVVSTGEVYRDIDLDKVASASKELVNKGVSALAICFLFSFLNPTHERLARDTVAKLFPEIFVSISSDIMPEMGEYARLVLSSFNAALRPVMSRYIARLEDTFSSTDLEGSIFQMMKSDGGTIPFENAVTNPVFTVLSGPAAGVVGAATVAAEAGRHDVITFDMGGTSTDVCLVQNGTPTISKGGVLVAGFPLQIRAIDITTIGAGGGSIAWIDSAGGLQVGPQSAGSDPGPVCYGHGGNQPTVTDADLVLGYINPKFFLEGRMKLDPIAAQKSIEKHIGSTLKLNSFEAAWAIHRIVNGNMVDAVREVSVKRGLDPREFALVACGGAGPVHIAGIALELEIPEIIIPYSPGTLSAYGLLCSNLKREYVQSLRLLLGDLQVSKLLSLVEQFEKLGQSWLEPQVEDKKQIVFEHRVDLRYVGQSYSLTIDFSPSELKESFILTKLEKDFAEAHMRMYGYVVQGAPIEVVNLRVEAIGHTAIRSKPFLRTAQQESNSRKKGFREAYFGPEAGLLKCPTYDRVSFALGATIEGPAIVEQADSTVVIPPKARGIVDDYGNIFMRW